MISLPSYPALILESSLTKRICLVLICRQPLTSMVSIPLSSRVMLHSCICGNISISCTICSTNLIMVSDCVLKFFVLYLTLADSQFPSVFSAPNPKHFATVEAAEQSLNQIHIFAPNLQWNEDDPPAKEILHARLRAKYYGAQVITYRHFVLKILEHSATRFSTTQGEPISGEFKPIIQDVPEVNANAKTIDDNNRKVNEYAKNCIRALIKSTEAFHGLGDPGDKRLIVTNVWGTAHAYVCLISLRE